MSVQKPQTSLDVKSPGADPAVGKATTETMQPSMANHIVEANQIGDGGPVKAMPDSPVDLPLPELLGRLLWAVIGNQLPMEHARRHLRVWYNAQPLEGRNEFAKEFRRLTDRAKLITEAIHQTAIETSMREQ